MLAHTVYSAGDVADLLVENSNEEDKARNFALNPVAHQGDNVNVAPVHHKNNNTKGNNENSDDDDDDDDDEDNVLLLAFLLHHGE